MGVYCAKQGGGGDANACPELAIGFQPWLNLKARRAARSISEQTLSKKHGQEVNISFGLSNCNRRKSDLVCILQ